jgi:hypothetical protein
MGLAYTKDSAYAKERVKWESQHTDLGPPGRPYEYQEYPKRMYKAGRVNGITPGIVEAITVESEVEERNMLSRGYRVGQDTALEALHAADQAVAEAAANRAFHEQRMSDKARREAAAADEVTPHHVPVIPEKPKRRGPKPRTPKPEVN